MLTFLKYLLYILIFLLIVLSIYSRIYENPYKCLILIGKKGSGKTTLSVKIAQKFLKLHWAVFSDSPIFDCFKLDVDWLGRRDFPENSLIIVDEGGITFDNRKYSSFSDELRNFFVLQRHKKVYVIILSQSFNVDKKIRDLTDGIYVVVNYFNVFSVAKKVHKGIGLSSDQDGCGNIAETYSWELPFNWMYAFIPRWIYFFDSFIAPELPKVSKVKHQFSDPDKISKYLSYRFYKVQQILSVVRFVNIRIPRPFWLYENDFIPAVFNKRGIELR